MWKYLYLGLFIPLKRNLERIGQSPALELGRLWIALRANKKGLTAGVYSDRGAIVPASICHIVAWFWNGSVNIERSAVVNMDCVTEEI